jgi:hypothetical protein
MLKRTTLLIRIAAVACDSASPLHASDANGRVDIDPDLHAEFALVTDRAVKPSPAASVRIAKSFKTSVKVRTTSTRW